MSLIFVSYRRQDTQSATGRLCDKLQTHFGAEQVFHDIESIEPGSDFAATIESKIAGSSVVLVMIGRHWAEATSDHGQARLFDPGDYVRLEIATALHRRIPVIPVLVEGATMPPAAALPDAIAGFSTRQAHEISEQRWQYDTDILVAQLERYVPAEGSSTIQATSTLVRTLFQSVVGWPFDFAQLLVRPRRQLNELLKQPNALTRAAAFFALSQLIAAWLFVLPDFVASVPLFVLEGLPMGLFILLLVLVPLHLSARLVRVPSHVPSTMMVLAYIESVAMVLAAVGVALMWAGFELSDPEFGQKVRTISGTNMPLDARLARMAGVIEAGIAGPFLAAFAFTIVIWLFAAGWLVVASQAFRDMWRISRLRFAAIVILMALALSIAGAFVTFAGTL